MNTTTNIDEERKGYVKPHYGNPGDPNMQTGWKSSDKHGHVKYWQMFAKESAKKHAGIVEEQVEVLDESIKEGDFVRFNVAGDEKVHRVFKKLGRGKSSILQIGTFHGPDQYGGTMNVHSSKVIKVPAPKGAGRLDEGVINEISRETLKSYYDKASQDRTKQFGSDRKYGNRLRGTSLTLKKMKEEEPDSRDDYRTMKVMHKGEHVANINTYRGRAGGWVSQVDNLDGSSASEKYGVDLMDRKSDIIRKIRQHHKDA